MSTDLYAELARFASVDPKDNLWRECRYVYFLSCPEASAVKIGVANNPWSRRKDIQSCNPLFLYIVALIETDRHSPHAHSIETKCHKAFSDLRIRGEWFQNVGALTDLIKYLQDCALNEDGRRECLDPIRGRT